MKYINVGLAKIHKVAFLALSAYFIMRLGALNTKWMYPLAKKEKL